MTSPAPTETSRAGISREYKQSFLLNEARLRKLASILEEYAAKVSPPAYLQFEVTRRDDSFYDTTDLAVVLGDDNTFNKAIIALDLRLLQFPAQIDAIRHDGPWQIARVTFGADPSERRFKYFRDDRTVRFSVIEKSRDWCFLLGDELDSQINRVLIHHSRWLPINFLDIAIPIVLLSGVGMWAASKLVSPTLVYTKAKIAAMSVDDRSRATLELVALQQGCGIGSLLVIVFGFLSVMLFIELKPLGTLWNRLYVPTFYWGDMVAIKDRSDKLANNVKWGIIAAFIVSVLASFAYAWITKSAKSD